MSLATLTVTPRSICGMSPQTPTNNIREALYKTYEITEANKNSTDAVKKRNTKSPLNTPAIGERPSHLTLPYTSSLLMPKPLTLNLSAEEAPHPK